MAAVPIPPIEFPRTYLAKRLPGRGSIDTRNKGFAWQVMRNGVRYRGPTLPTRALGVVRERCRQIEEIGLYKIRRSGDGGLSMMPDRAEYAASRRLPGCP